MLKFPPNFIFGTATAGHQIEGDNKSSDWWYYEQNGKLPFESGKACNHWNLYRQDIELMHSLGYNAYRFSIEWARIFPKEGKIDKKALQRYQEIINLLNENGIIPLVTLHHFTLPLWFLKKGGFAKEENLRHWEEYLKALENILEVRLIATFNEPMVYVANGYIFGKWPPFEKSPKVASIVAANILKAHSIAYEILHKEHKVGIVKNIPIFLAASQKNDDLKAARRVDNIFNFKFLNAIWDGTYEGIIGKYKVPESDIDFIGVNYYTAYQVRHSHNPFKFFLDARPAEIGERRTDMGWSVYPEGIYKAVEKVYRYKRPIYITENGIATEDDEWRISFIVQHLNYLHRAINDGYNVKGYFYWSFMDNFEWDKGFGPKFGLVEINYKNFQRKPRKSAHVYGYISKEKGIKDEILEK